MIAILYFVFVAFLAIGVWRKPALGLSFLLSTFAIEQWLQSKDVFFILNNRLVNISTLFILVVALGSKFMNERGVMKNYPLAGVLTMCLYIYAFFSILWVNDPELSFSVYYKYLPYIIPIVVLSPLLVNSIKDVQVFLYSLWGIGIFLALVFMFFTNWSYRQIVLAGDYEMVANPLAIASFFGYIIILSVFVDFSMKVKGIILLKWFVVGICLILIVKSGSRGQFLFVLFVTLILYSVRRSLSVKNTVLVMLVSGIVSVAGYMILQEYSGGDARWDSSNIDSDVSGRLSGAITLLGVWLENPINIMLGLGSSASYDEQILGFYPHVVPLEILGEEGLIGFGLFIAILFMSAKAFKQTLGLTKNNTQLRSYAIAIGAMLLYDFMLSLKQGSFLGSPNMFCLIILLSRLHIIYQEKLNTNSTQVNNEIDDPVKVDVGIRPEKAYAGVRLK